MPKHCAESVIQSLGPKVFERYLGESLSQRLAEISEESVEKSLNTAGKKVTKKSINQKKEELTRLQNKVNNCLKIYHLGQSTTYTSINDAVSGLTLRDYPLLEDFDGNETLKIFIPEIFLTTCPSIIGQEEYSQLREALRNDNPELVHNFDGQLENLKGFLVEELCFDSFKIYFGMKDESITLIHSLDFLPLSSGKEKVNSKEKDFVIVNYTHCYIMVVEVKRVFKCVCKNNKDVKCPMSKSANQIQDGKTSLETWFGTEFDDNWSVGQLELFFVMNVD